VAVDFLPPDIARRLLNRDLSNLIRRVQGGGKLSRQERSMLQSMAAGGEGASTPVTAANFVELASILGVTRQAVHAWKRMEGAPQAAANGLHDVAAWREFMRAKGLKGGEPVTDVETSLKARKLLAEVEERELRLAVRRGELIEVENVRSEWTRQVGRARALMEARLLNELPPVLCGKDAVGIRAEMERFVEEFCGVMHAGRGDVRGLNLS